MKTDLILTFKQNLFSKVIWSSTFNSMCGRASPTPGFHERGTQLQGFLEEGPSIIINLLHCNGIKKSAHMCCYLPGSVGSWEQWLWDTAWKGNAFLLFSIVFENLSIAVTWNHWSDSGWVFSKMYLS